MKMATYDEKNLLALGTRNMILFFIGKLFASLGSSVYAFVVSFYILKETGSVMNFSISLLCGALPRILLGPFSGVVSDRFNRKKIIIIFDILNALIIGGACVLFATGNGSIVVLYVTTALVSIVNTFYSTALSSAIPNMIDTDRIQKVGGINQAIVSLSGMLGPVIGGALFALLSLPVFMLLNTITILISVVTAILIRYDLYVGERKAEQDSVMESLKTGFRYIKNHRFLFTLIKFAFILNFLFAALMVYLPYIMVTIRNFSSTKVGLIEGSIALGMFVFSLILSTQKDVRNKERVILLSLAAQGVLMMIIGFTAHDVFGEINQWYAFVVLGVSCFLMGAFIMLVNIPIFVLLQKETPDDVRGRVMAFLETGASAITPLGYVLFGAIASFLSPLYSLGVIGLTLSILSLFLLKKKALKIDVVEKVVVQV